MDRRTVALLAALALAAGCDDGGGGRDAGPDAEHEAGPDADVGDADGDGDGGDADLEPVLPPPLAWVAPDGEGGLAERNAIVRLVTLGPVDPDTLLVEIDGVPVRVVTLDDVEFRFVPFPLLAPDHDHVVTIVAGLEGPEVGVLERDFSWSFRTVAEQPEVSGDPTLTPAEVALISAEDADTPMDLVQDWDDPDSTLHDICLPLDPTSAEARHLIARMMVSVVHHGGIGLAAPQVGINRRLFVASVGAGFEAFMNPNVLAFSDQTDDMVEGCLSIPGQRHDVARPTWVELAYDDGDGLHVGSRTLENPADSLMSFPARVWLHEFDHLNGILITDRSGRR